MVATAWPAEVRADLDRSFAAKFGATGSIRWVVLEPGESRSRVVDRRGGVDVILGGPAADHLGLDRAGRLINLDSPGSTPWKLARRPGSAPNAPANPQPLSDPRADHAAITRARRTLDEAGWSTGYEALVRQAARRRPRAWTSASRPDDDPTTETVSWPEGGKNRRGAARFLDLLRSRGLIDEAGPRAIVEARTDGLLADLLGSALIDAHDELRAADAALARFGHPTRAEAAIGEAPPWPPASVDRLRADPNGEVLVETLLGQIAPDPESRAWLMASWSRPKRPIDGALLEELAGALDGRLARETRFRAWLRAEWTAWTRQLYRRVARVAGGYLPS